MALPVGRSELLRSLDSGMAPACQRRDRVRHRACLLGRDPALRSRGLTKAAAPSVAAKRVGKGKQGLRSDVREHDRWIDRLGSADEPDSTRDDIRSRLDGNGEGERPGRRMLAYRPQSNRRRPAATSGRSRSPAISKFLDEEATVGFVSPGGYDPASWPSRKEAANSRSRSSRTGSAGSSA